MTDRFDVVGSLITGGVGATLASIVVAIIQLVGHRGESRATAADVVTEAAERVMTRLEKENEHMRAALVAVMEVLDQIITSLEHTGSVQPEELAALRAAYKAAKLAA